MSEALARGSVQVIELTRGEWLAQAGRQHASIAPNNFDLTYRPPAAGDLIKYVCEAERVEERRPAK